MSAPPVDPKREGRPLARGACLSLEEVAAALGLSPAYVLQIEMRALRKLRKSRLLRELFHV